MSAPDGWDAWASAVVTREHIASRGAHPAQMYATDKALERLERDIAYEVATRSQRRRQRRRLVLACVLVAVGVVLVVAGCAPANAAPPAPSIDAWATVTARPGLTPTHVGACVADIDTNVAAELVKARNAANNEYGPMPQAGFPYEVPASTINCEGITG